MFEENDDVNEELFKDIDENKYGNKCEEQIKNILSDVILSLISTYNKKINDTNIKFVIGGGSAFNYYFKKEEAEIFQTHDFDIRCVYDGYIDNGYIISILKEQQTEFVEFMNDELNIFFNKNSELFDNIITSVRENAPNFRFLFSGFEQDRLFFNQFGSYAPLQSVSYKYTMGNSLVKTSIIDVTVFSPENSLTSYYGYPSIMEDKYSLEEHVDFFETNDGAGYFRNVLLSDSSAGTIVNAGDYVYYVSLGYLMWDTVRMLNKSVRAERRHPSSTKYIRYLKKYYQMLYSLNYPTKYLNCDSTPMNEYIKNCLS